MPLPRGEMGKEARLDLTGEPTSQQVKFFLPNDLRTLDLALTDSALKKKLPLLLSSVLLEAPYARIGAPMQDPALIPGRTFSIYQTVQPLLRNLKCDVGCGDGFSWALSNICKSLFIQQTAHCDHRPGVACGCLWVFCSTGVRLPGLGECMMYSALF